MHVTGEPLWLRWAYLGTDSSIYYIPNGSHVGSDYPIYYIPNGSHVGFDGPHVGFDPVTNNMFCRIKWSPSIQAWVLRAGRRSYGMYIEEVSAHPTVVDAKERAQDHFCQWQAAGILAALLRGC